eukprot:CAMPEP_0119482510 /NCGR_PEP_ID=MMETSP1344-20130328/10329_1 /TAXON_ID=236787 /ORGANISM="Florenciella parvula, Strain CCMP2471" /LENGTH=195 /DNA_ID=CAMNT_0007516911 /DNA_START=479 /DNA_END=1066 /DNA_ORIENTATION=+
MIRSTAALMSTRRPTASPTDRSTASASGHTQTASETWRTPALDRVSKAAYHSASDMSWLASCPASAPNSAPSRPSPLFMSSTSSTRATSRAPRSPDAARLALRAATSAPHRYMTAKYCLASSARLRSVSPRVSPSSSGGKPMTGGPWGGLLSSGHSADPRTPSAYHLVPSQPPAIPNAPPSTRRISAHKLAREPA